MSSLSTKRLLAGFRPRKPSELWLWMRNCLGLEIPTIAVCPEHQPPFLAMWRAFSATTPHSGLWLANRSGGKTTIFATLHHANSVFKDDCYTAHAAAVEDQAKNAKRYLDRYFDFDMWSGWRVPPLNSAEWTYYKNRSRLQIKPGTLNAMSSSKPNVAALDEVEFWKWEHIQQAIGMPFSLPGRPATMLFGSTRQRMWSSMYRLTENAAQMGLAVTSWCVWETVKRCPTANRSCPLWERCEGWRCQKGDGYWDIADVIQKTTLADDETWDTQYACRRPSRRGLVFDTFDAITHVDTRWEYRKDLAVEIAVDWGYQAPAAVIFAQRNNMVRWIFDDIYVNRLETEELWEEVRKKAQKYGGFSGGFRILRGWGDGEDPEKNNKFRRWLAEACPGSRWFLGVSSIADRNSAVRQGLKDARGKATLFFHPRCVSTLREFSLYHCREIGTDGNGKPVYSEEPVDADDHAMSALGFFCFATRAGASTMGMRDVIRVQPRQPGPMNPLGETPGDIRNKQW